MRLDGPDLGFSATDLSAFAGCGQRSLLDRLRVLGKATVPLYKDPRLDLLKQRGLEHEQRYLEHLSSGGKRIVRFEPLEKSERNPASYARRAERTLAAMRDGADVIYQGTLFDPPWLGLVDFLLRVDRPSGLGAWSYEVADAKLAREAKAAALLQTCVYSEMLEKAQGTRPERVHLYLGGPSPTLASFRLTHYAAYYRALRARFLTHVGAAGDDVPVAPDPVELCQICDWRGRCAQERDDVDHLSLVAGITRDHRRALGAAGVTTLSGLAGLPLDPPPEGLRRTGFQRIREQARVQREGREREAPVHEILPSLLDEDPRPLGLRALPAPSAHDLFFDIEGADYAYEEGLQYLFGVSDARDDYDADWALTPDEEKAMLERFLLRVHRHVEAHPDAHVYHFGHYEPSTLKRLVGRYGVGTQALDDLLRGQVFVDLHTIVKQAVRASVDRYSIKTLEPFYAFERKVPLPEAGAARGRLEYALATRVEDPDAASDRGLVQDYNRDDCLSTRALRDWLETLRVELSTREGRDIPRPGAPAERDEEEVKEDAEVRALMDRLLEGVSESARSPEEQVRWLAAHLIEWHRREDKSAWWEYFDLKKKTIDELIAEPKPLAGLEYEGIIGPVKQSQIHRFRFPPQQHRMEEGKNGLDAHAEKGTPREVWHIDEIAGTIDLKIGNRTEFDPTALKALLPDEIVGTKGQRKRLRETARLLIEGERALGEWSPASLALLRRDPPRLPLASASLRDRAVEAALRMENGALPVQGPPGTGKTYCGARMIRALLREGRRVGITGPSHKVITNIVQAVCDAGDDPETPIVGVQVGEEERCADPRIAEADNTSDLAKVEARRAKEGEPPFNLVAGTAWLWCADRMERSVDVLFIDEAGQFSLANALAVAPAAPRLVLLGDPQQLDQPRKGTHPPGTGESVLEHLAGESGILTGDRGLFLAETWRMRPEITAYTSELFYDGQLGARPDLAAQRLTLPGGEAVQGLFRISVEHDGNSRESKEEADAVLGIFRRLLSGRATFTDRHGATRDLALNDLLVVAPYNAQVARITRVLEDAGFPNPRVGTVDKFQGQEAPVAIYSLASSSAEDAPRGMAFLYALDRLNVATSRARCATLVVASPRVFTAACSRPDQMRMVNALVRYGEMGRGMG